MDKFESLSHTAWECKYHVVFIPKCRRRTLYAQLRSCARTWERCFASLRCRRRAAWRRGT